MITPRTFTVIAILCLIAILLAVIFSMQFLIVTYIMSVVISLLLMILIISGIMIGQIRVHIEDVNMYFTILIMFSLGVVNTLILESTSILFDAKNAWTFLMAEFICIILVTIVLAYHAYYLYKNLGRSAIKNLPNCILKHIPKKGTPDEL